MLVKNKTSKFNQSSDIFNLKSNEEKKEIPHKIRNRINRITYDFKNWDSENNNILNQTMKTPFISNNFKSNIFSNEPIITKPIKIRHNNKTNFSFGNYDNSEFNVHKNLNNTICYDLFKNYKEKDISAYERKMKQLYGNDFNINNEKNIINFKNNFNQKTTFGTIENEEKKYDEPKIEFKNAKERKYNELFHDRKENINNNNLYKNNIYINNSSNKKFIEGKYADHKNYINSLKSNIFNDPKKDNLNNEEIEEKKNNNNYIKINKINKYYGKKKILEKDTGTLPAQLDWKDERTNLFNQEKPFSKREKESAFIRKINDLYGENANNKLNNNNNKNNEDYNKKEIEKFIIEKYPNDNESQIKKRLEYISDINKNNNSNENYNLNHNNNENIINKNYEIQFDKINNVNIPEFKKVFIDNGIHIYGFKEDISYNNGKNKKGRILFSIRENYTKGEFDNKLNNIRNKIEKEQGIKFIDYNQDKRKKNANAIPSSMKWDNNLSNLFKTEGNEKMRIIKGRKNFLKKGEKISDINVDHNYKRNIKK